MNILLCSYAFAPSTGGIESMSKMLAEKFSAKGHAVTVLTQTPSDKEDELPYRLIRRPSIRTILEETKRCDVLFHNNISLRLLYPSLLVRKPLVIAIRTWVTRPNGKIGIQDRIKLAVLKRASKLIANSQATSDHISAESVVIQNSYDDALFRNLNLPRNLDFVFVGRLVSDKGADMAIKAIAKLRDEGDNPTLTIIGDGPEEQALKDLVSTLNLKDLVSFTGRLTGESLVQTLNEHKILVVPSLWNEPFGIVAIEGIACGCVVVGSQGGGLKDAIGKCGLTFPNGNIEALTECLRSLLSSNSVRLEALSHSAHHLHKHKTESVADAYLQVISEAV